jgi:hypothetical protein
MASRRARRQLMRVPWGRFHTAYEEYIRWQGFVLWVRAVVETKGHVPSWLEEVLRKRCPGFLEQRVRSKKKHPLDLQLRIWIDNKIFRSAKDEGWLDALALYGFRDARSQGNCAYWEHCENGWKKRRPTSFPTFAEWWRSALAWKLHDDVSSAAVTDAVEKYIGRKAFVYWLRPLFQAPNVQLPTHVTVELGRKCPVLLEFLKTHTSAVHGNKSRSWPRLVNWSKDQGLERAKREGWLDCVLSQARIHPRHVRMADYALRCARPRLASPTSPHPSLGEWKRDAESYVRQP